MTIEGINTLSATSHNQQHDMIAEWIGLSENVGRPYGATGIAKLHYGNNEVNVVVGNRHGMPSVAISTELNGSLISGLIKQLTDNGSVFTQMTEDLYVGEDASNIAHILPQFIRPSRRKSKRTGIILHLSQQTHKNKMNRLIKAFVAAIREMKKVNPAFENLANLVEAEIRNNTEVYSK
jgi:hypothetical protein